MSTESCRPAHCRSDAKPRSTSEKKEKKKTLVPLVYRLSIRRCLAFLFTAVASHVHRSAVELIIIIISMALPLSVVVDCRQFAHFILHHSPAALVMRAMRNKQNIKRASHRRKQQEKRQNNSNFSVCWMLRIFSILHRDVNANERPECGLLIHANHALFTW